jgi:hypothetical protein
MAAPGVFVGWTVVAVSVRRKETLCRLYGNSGGEQGKGAYTGSISSSSFHLLYFTHHLSLLIWPEVLNSVYNHTESILLGQFRPFRHLLNSINRPNNPLIQHAMFYLKNRNHSLFLFLI